jgi:FkbM family methyltransferase
LKLRIKNFQNIKRVFTHIFVNKPAFFLPEKLYISYIILISFFRLRNYSSYESKLGNFKIHQIHYGNQKIAFTSGYRISRFARGFNNAGSRVWKRYLVDKVINDVIPNTIIDIGSNIGEFTNYVNDKYMGKVKIYSIDPDPVAVECFEINCTGINIKLFPIALSNQSGIYKIYLVPESADTSFHKPTLDTYEHYIETETLDNLFSDFDLETPVLLKMDAEGNEPEILRGGTKLLKKISFISIDCGPERKGFSTTQEVILLLEAEGFSIIESPNPDIVLANKVIDNLSD